MYKNSVVHYIAKTMVDIMFYCGIVCVITLPVWVKWVKDSYGYEDAFLVHLIVILSVSGLCAVYILFNLKRMFKTLLSGNPFVNENVCYFRKIAVACAIISVIYITKLFYMYSNATVIIIIVFSIGCLFCLTLKDIFKQAIAYKEENDWTV